MLDRVGDLELAPRRRLDRARGVEDVRAEEVDADQRHVRRRVLRLFHQADDAIAVELGDAVVPRVVDLGEEEERVVVAAAEGVDELGDAVAKEVVAQVHDEGARAQRLLGGEDGVGETARRVLLDVGDLGAEGRTVARSLADLAAGLGRDDDHDLGHAGTDQRLDPVEEHGLVGDRDELLGRGVRDRPQARPRAPREDQSLERLHGRRRLPRVTLLGVRHGGWCQAPCARTTSRLGLTMLGASFDDRGNP